MWLEKNVVFNKLIYFDLKKLKRLLKDIIIIIEAPELLIILLGGFILEDFEEEEIRDIIKILPLSLPEYLSETSKERSAALALVLSTPRATVSPEPAPLAGSALSAGDTLAELAPSLEISIISKLTKDPRNIIEGY